MTNKRIKIILQTMTTFESRCNFFKQSLKTFRNKKVLEVPVPSLRDMHEKCADLPEGNTTRFICQNG